MKKIVLLLSLLSGFILFSACDKEKIVQEEDLPEAAKTFIHRYFPELTITHILLDKEGKNKNYEVIFSNGTDIEFDKKGEWLAVDCKQSRVPDTIIPAPVLEHIVASWAGRFITKIEKQRNGYEVGINSGEELLFSADGTFIGFDR